jgi:hypothetical protein
MSVQPKRKGGCLCGAVRYEVYGEPYQSGLCHCRTCKRLTGSAFSATANWRAEQFQMSGEIRTFDKRSFCPACGSRLFYMLADGVEVFLGTLGDAPHGIIPMVEVWTVWREPWLAPVDGAIPHDRNEVSLEEER